MSRIFISYRRSDSISEAGRIYDYLYSHFGGDSIFKDVDDIEAGDDFGARVREAVGQCQVLLAVIGRSWLTAVDGSGNRRLDNPADWVRLEIETALRRNVRVIPILLDGVEMPAAQALPEVLRPLAFRNAARVRYDPDFRRDMDRVIAVVRRHIEALEGSPRREPIVPPQGVKVPPAEKPPTQGLSEFEFETATIVRVEKGGGFLGLGAPKVITRRQKAKASFYREDLGGGVTLDLVKIPGGTFLMGSSATEIDRKDHEGPQHLVTLQPFFIGKYPVTQAQWKAVALLPKVECDLDSDPSRFKGGSRPVEQVSWNQAMEFCKRLSKRFSKQSATEYRLPSEAEWEYACRAGTTTPFYLGDTLTSELANYNATYTYGSGPKGEYKQRTTDAGSYVPNAFGLYDMHGNVREWCADHWHDSYEDAPINGSAWLSDNVETSRVHRGGSWYNSPRFCRSAYRFDSPPDNRYDLVGFRVSCSAPRTLE